MILGLLVVGMLVGAAAGGLCFLATGSLILAAAVYGFAGAAVVLAIALLSFFLSERRTAATAEPVPAAE